MAQLVEHHLAKVRVAGSSPVFRSIPFTATDPLTTVGPSSSGRTPDFGSENRGSNPRGPAKSGRRTQVVKGEVCKTSIHRFESGRRLQNHSQNRPSRGRFLAIRDSANAISGGGGGDNVKGVGGNDIVSGGSGNDTVRGGSEDDTVLGNAGNDALRGQAGTDTCSGGSGSDTAAGSCETITGVP